MAMKVCLLGSEEARVYESGGHVNCRDHRHAKTAQAAEMTAGPEPLARQIDRRHIVLIRRREWRRAWSGGYCTMQFLPVGARGGRNPFSTR